MGFILLIFLCCYMNGRKERRYLRITLESLLSALWSCPGDGKTQVLTQKVLFALLTMSDLVLG